MAVELTLRGDLYRYTTSVDLDGIEVRLSLTWSARCGAWYADVADADGVLLVAGARVTPGAPLLSTAVSSSLPGGRLVVLGPDPYQREDLGSAVRVVYLTAADLA